MGVGKTTVGRVLAEKVGFQFIDLDEIIETRQKRSISEIFAEMGEARFREIERCALEDCRVFTRTIIALGGGAFVSEENRAIISRIGKSVWLDCSLDVILARISGSDSRPLLGERESMKLLLESRHPAYALADYRVEAENGTPDIIADQIGRILNL